MNYRDADSAIMAMAARQHGVVSRSQLLAAGVAPKQVERNVRRQRLRPLQRGVYLVGPLELPLTHSASAVLSCGTTAVLSHGSAAALWGLVRQAPGSEVDVIVPPRVRRSRDGVRAHRLVLQPDEVTRREGLTVTTPGRTLYDLAAHMSGRDLERVVAEALAQRLTTRPKLERVVQRYAHRPASRRLAEIIGSGRRAALTRSAAEEAFLALVTKAQLPRPEVNVRVAGLEVDFYWKRARLVVEIDGFMFHTTRRKFESDRRRDAVLLASGVRVMRVTWQQLEHEREVVLVRLAQVLAGSVEPSGAGPRRRR